SSGGRDEFLLTSDTPRLLMPPDMAYLIAEVICPGCDLRYLYTDTADQFRARSKN
ncbi:hypothetical protein DFQ45_103225, partial [Thiopseudomonas denitrificans]